MAVSYKNLFNVLNKKGIKKIELQKNLNLSPTTVAKLSKNENISLDILDKICSYLQCNIEDIISF